MNKHCWLTLTTCLGLFLGLVDIRGQTSLNDGLIAYFPFNGNADDASGFGRHGVVNGPLVVSDRRNVSVNGAYLFDGDQDIIRIEDGSWVPRGRSEFTISMWINLPPESVNYDHKFLITIDAIEQWQFFIGGISAMQSIEFYTGRQRVGGTHGITSWEFNKWYHIVLTRKSVPEGQDVVTWYRDGVQIASAGTTVEHSSPLQANGVTIGRRQNGYGSFRGKMDDIRIYNRALSSNDVTRLYDYELEICTPTRAAAKATIANGFVIGATIEKLGCGYTNAPLVLIRGGGGSGAAGYARIEDGQVIGIVITNAGCCYTSTPKIEIASPPFEPSVAIAVSKINVVQKIVLGRNYILQSSDNLIEWTPVGEPFMAESESITNEFSVQNVGRHFRLREVR